MSRSAAGSVVVLFLGALVLRLWGSVLGLPQAYLPDEGWNLEVAERLAGAGVAPPAIQPGFLFYSLSLLLPLFHAIGVGLEWLSPDLADRVYSTELSAGLWAGRAWMAVLSAATVVPLHGIGRRVSGAAAGLGAAFLFAVDPVSIAAAGYIKEDTPLTLWMAVAAWAAVVRLDRRRAGDAAVAGFAAGLCIGSKFTGVFALGLVLLPELLLRRQRAKTHVMLLLAMAGLGFVLTTPWILAEPGRLLAGLEYQSSYAVSGHHDGIALPLWETRGVFYLINSVFPALGPVGLFLAGAGALISFRSRRDFALVLLAWSVGYVALMEAFPAKPYPFFSRYVLPGLAGFSALGGIALGELGARALDRRGRWRGLARAALALALLLPAWTAGRFVAAMYPDTRDVAREWIVENHREGDVFFVSAYAPSLADEGFREFRLPLLGRGHRCRTWPQYVVTTDLALGRYRENPVDVSGETSRILAILDGATRVAEFDAGTPRFGFSNPRIDVLRVDPDPPPGCSRRSG